MEWQKSLSRIAATKGRRFVQVDFSATPYNDVGRGKNKRKVYFAHIVTDFDLKSAMRAGLVKSLVLDRRKEIGALPLGACRSCKSSAANRPQRSIFYRFFAP